MQVNWRGRFAVAGILFTIVGLFFLLPLPPFVWSMVTLLLAAAAAYEWGRLCDFNRADNALYVGLFVLFCVVVAWRRDGLFVQHTYIGLVALFWVGAAPWWMLKGWFSSRLLSAVLGLLTLSAVWNAADLLYEHDTGLLFAGLLLVWVFDSASYFVGRAIGNIPLAPAISPKKTVEGLLGGVGAVFIGSLIYRLFERSALPLAVLLSAVFSLAVLALLGDLFISALKRYAGVKDTGRLLGHHGGILDRIDGVLPVLPIVALLSPWIE